MNKFLTIGLIIIIMSLLSCSSGIIGVLAAAVLPLFSIVGVGLMTLNVLVANGEHQNNDPAVVLGDFMDLMLVYSAKLARGLFFGIGKMIGWGMPNMIGPGGGAAPEVPAELPPAAVANGKKASQSSLGAVKIKVHIYLHNKHDKKPKKFPKQPPPVASAARSSR